MRGTHIRRGFCFENKDHTSEIEFFATFEVNQNLTCNSKIEVAYYSKGFTLVCVVCGEDISDNEKLVDEYKSTKDNFVQVLPTCKCLECGDFICSRKRKVRKRPAPPAQKQPAPKKQKPGDGGGGAKIKMK